MPQVAVRMLSMMKHVAFHLRPPPNQQQHPHQRPKAPYALQSRFRRIPLQLYQPLSVLRRLLVILLAMIRTHQPHTSRLVRAQTWACKDARAFADKTQLVSASRIVQQSVIYITSLLLAISSLIHSHLIIFTIWPAYPQHNPQLKPRRLLPQVADLPAVQLTS